LTPHLTLRKFLIDDAFTATTQREVKQLHYTGWPDYGVPSGKTMESFKTMMDYLILAILTTKPEEKIVIHCSAGIGRTGSTIALAHLIMNAWAQKNVGVADPEVSVFSTIRRMREQRYHLVQSLDQFEFVHTFFLNYLQTVFLS